MAEVLVDVSTVQMDIKGLQGLSGESLKGQD